MERTFYKGEIMNHIEKALEQMNRGISSDDGMKAVNEETRSERIRFQYEWINRQKELKNNSFTKPVKDFDKRMRDGEMGRLD